jgi:pyruvate dehydrogenase E2 component (dihydrolipoamide acetyltransferase)
MDVKLPPLGEGADSGIVVNLFVKEGDRITRDQPLLELENEKAVATIPSTATGTVAKIYVKPGDKLSVGQKILSVTGGMEAPAKTEPPAGATTPAAEPQAEVGKAATDESSPPEDTGEPVSAPIAASPAIRQLARELGIDLSRVRGTARGGRIQMQDLRAYIQRLQQLASAPRTPGTTAPASPRLAPEPIDFAKWGPISKQPLSPLRQVIARRLSESWNAIPHVTQFDEADLTTLMSLRKKHLAAYEKKGARLTVTTLLLRAVVNTLKNHPIFNASLDEAAGAIVLKHYFHLGIAVDTDAGLIVPVIRNVDQKDLVNLARDLEELAVKARERKVSAEELKGGTFTISNQGGIGGAHFTPIVNKPEVAILGLGRAALKPVAREGKVELRTLLPLGLSYDHRVIDGAQAARFMVDLVKAIEGFEERDVAFKS